MLHICYPVSINGGSILCLPKNDLFLNNLKKLTSTNKYGGEWVCKNWFVKIIFVILKFDILISVDEVRVEIKLKTYLLL